MKDYARFPLLVTLIALAEIFLVLVFPFSFNAVLTASIIISAIIFIIFLWKRQFLTAILFVFILIFSAVNPYTTYLSKEERAEKLISDFDGTEAVFSARITDCRHYSSYSVLYADIYSAGGRKLSKPFSARVSSYTASGVENGDYIEFSGVLKGVSNDEDETFDTRSYLRSKGCFIDVQSAVITRSAPSDSISLFSKIRGFSKNLIYKYAKVGYDYDVPSVCYAMFSGDKDYLSSDLKDIFTRSGTIHILCVSGMHLTIIAGALYSLLSLLSVHKKAKCIIVIAVCCFYCVFTGFSPSTIRACIMCVISFFALMTGKKTDGYMSLFFAVLIICTFSPYTILDISLVLSFCACLGIMAFSEFIPSYNGKSKFIKALSLLFGALLINLGAVLFTLPISAYSFGSLSHMSAPATLTVSFAAQMLLTLLLAMHLLSPLSFISFISPVFEFLGRVIKMLCTFIIKSAQFFSDLDYSSTAIDKDDGTLYLCIFAFLLLVLTLFIALGFKRARFFICLAIISTGIIFSNISLYNAIEMQGNYTISYFRQNEDDRQLSIKLMHHGYLIVNADNVLCTNKSKAEFDTKHGKNYLLLIPDELINTKALCENIRNFDSRYGIAKIFVPDTSDGALLAKSLFDAGIKCYALPENLNFGNLDMHFHFDEFSRIKLNDGKTSATIVFSETYNEEYFDTYCDIAAFFTRKTKNQFKPSENTMPECEVFFTRMKKEESLDKVINTFGKKHFKIKE